MTLVAYAYSSVGQLLGDGGPIRLVTGGSVILGELGGFNTHSLTFAVGALDESGVSDAERLIDALEPWTLIQLMQTPFNSVPGDDGTLAWGYVLNPRQQISDRDEHTITLELYPLTDELTDHRVHRGWQAQNTLSVIASRIGSFRQGWTGVFTDAGTASDITVLVTSPDTTPLDLFLSTATQFSQYARQGVDGYGVPTRVLEMGQFGAAPTITLTSANGGDAEAMAANGTVRVPATIDRSPADVTNLMTTCTPFGGGTSTDSVVTLERLWRIINDPTYPNYGKYGNVPGSVFPEYDPNYPISDPENAPAGRRLYLTPAGTLIAPGVFTDAQIVAGGGVLLQGAVGTRYPTLDGHWDYMVYDNLAYIGPNGKGGYGHRDREFIQPQISYTDTSVANQELSARALYLSAIANFKRFAHPHHTFACTVANANGRVTRAGDQIAVDYQRATSGTVEMNVQENLIVMRTTRHFEGETPPYDELLLSNLGRFDRDDPAGSASAAKAIIALQINQNTSVAPLSIDADGNTDTLHPLVRPKRRPATLFRWHVCQLRVDPSAFTGTADTTTGQSAATITLSVPHGTHNVAPVAGHAFDGSGISTVNQQLPVLPEHYHFTDVSNFPLNFTVSSTPATLTPDRYLWVGGDNDSMQFRSNGHSGRIPSEHGVLGVDLAGTAHAHTTPIQQAVALEHPTSLSGPLPQHDHGLVQKIPNGPTASVWNITIGGQSIPLGTALRSGTRNADGTFSGSVEFADLSALMNGLPTDDFTIAVTPHTDGGNPFGASYFTVTGIFMAEYGGLSSTVIAS